MSFVVDRNSWKGLEDLLWGSVCIQREAWAEKGAAGPMVSQVGRANCGMNPACTKDPIPSRFKEVFVQESFTVR